MKKLVAACAAVSLLTWLPGVLPESVSMPLATVQAAAVMDNATQVSVDGFGAMPANMPIGRAKIMARRAAIVDAQRNLVEQINGTAVDAETSMENYVIQSDVVRTKVQGTIRGASIQKEEITSDGLYHVVLAVPMYGVGSLSAAVIPALVGDNHTPTPILTPGTTQISTTPLPASTTASGTDLATTDNTAPYGSPEVTAPAPTAVKATNGGYTGLVIDARNAQMIRAFAPNIVDSNGRVIYSIKNVSEDYAIKYGMVSYAEGAENWQKVTNGTLSRVGSRPLVIKMAAPKKRCVYNCDVVVSPADGDRILAENQRTHFLDQYAVTFEI